MSGWGRFVAVIFCSLITSGAAAQVKQGQFRLFMDTDLFNFERTTIEKVGEREIETQYDFGPGGSAISASLPGYVGLGVGYAIRRRFVLSLHFSFARHQSIHQFYADGAVQPNVNEPTVSTFMLRPELEVPFNPKSRAVVALLAGFDFKQAKIQQSTGAQDTRYRRDLTALGPVAGLATHFFVVESASIDLSAVAVIDIIDAQGGGPGANAPIYRAVALSLMLGLSLWP